MAVTPTRRIARRSVGGQTRGRPAEAAKTTDNTWWPTSGFVVVLSSSSYVTLLESMSYRMKISPPHDCIAIYQFRVELLLLLRLMSLRWVCFDVLSGRPDTFVLYFFAERSEICWRLWRRPFYWCMGFKNIIFNISSISCKVFDFKCN